MKNFLLVGLAALCIACGDGGGPDPKVEANRTQSAVKMREIFDRAGGNYEAMSPADRQAYVDMFKGNETDAKRMWDFIKFQSGARPAGAPSK